MHQSDEAIGKKWKLTRDFLRHVERHAAALRDRAGIGPLDKLSPKEVADKFDTRIVYPDEITALPPEDRAYLSSLNAKVWSGISKTLPDGTLLVILNPNQTPDRANVTIMEEVAHAYYGHKPSQLNGIEERRYDEEAEREAYWTAAAALLPSKVVAEAVWRGQSAKQLAAKSGASVELAEMRIRVLGLWNQYKDRKVSARLSQ